MYGERAGRTETRERGGGETGGWVARGRGSSIAAVRRGVC